MNFPESIADLATRKVCNDVGITTRGSVFLITINGTGRPLYSLISHSLYQRVGVATVTNLLNAVDTLMGHYEFS